MKLLPCRFVRDAAYLLPSQRLRGGILLPLPRVIKGVCWISSPGRRLILFGQLPQSPIVSISSIRVLRASFTGAAFEADKILDRYRRSPIAIHQVEGLSFDGSRHGRPGAIGSLAGNVSSSDSSRKSSCSCSEVSVSLDLLAASAVLIISIPLILGPTNVASLAALRH